MFSKRQLAAPCFHLPLFVCILTFFAFTAVGAFETQNVEVADQVRYAGRLTDVRIQELQDLAQRLQHSVNPDKYACDSFYDYVCSRNRQLFSVLGHLPDFMELIHLFKELQDDPIKFEAKQKLIDFFISCNTIKSVEECYYQTFDYFKPLFGYIINKNYIGVGSQEHRNFLDVLDRFLIKAESIDDYKFRRNPIRLKLVTLREKFRLPQIFFSVGNINQEFSQLRIYRESYHHNLINLEQHRKRQSTFDIVLPRTMLDWSLYVYQSRNKPMTFYFPTLNLHLWMALYNTTERYHGMQRSHEIAECLGLPKYVSVLEEARILAVVYLKSFANAKQEFHDWFGSSHANKRIFDQENDILRQYNLSNKKLFYTLYAQNFCEFGRELAENIFTIDLKRNNDFDQTYSCGMAPKEFECVLD